MSHVRSCLTAASLVLAQVLLRLGWSYPVDIWSCGRILAELATGTVSLTARNDLYQLAMMKRVRGGAQGGDGGGVFVWGTKVAVWATMLTSFCRAK